MAENHVTLVGNTTDDPELRTLPKGGQLTTFRLAVTRRYKDNTGEVQRNTGFFNVACWGDLAEHVAETVSKGDRLTVVGRLELDQWTDKDGGHRERVQIRASDVSVSLRWSTATIHHDRRRG